MASLETTRGRQVPAWQQANSYYQQPVDYVNVRQPESTNASTAPATRRRRTTNGNYRIQKGDTLSAIAQRYGTTIQAIAEANGIADVNRIYVGDTLNIPENNTTRTNTSTQRTTTTSTQSSTSVNRSQSKLNNTSTNTVVNRASAPRNNLLTQADIDEANAVARDIQIRDRYQRQINNQRARDEYYRNQRMAQGRRAEQRAANRPNYEGLRNFTIAAAAAPGAYLFGTAAAPYVMQGAQTVSNGKNWVEAGNRVTEGAKRIGTRIEQNAIARNNVRGIKEANRAAQQLERPINSHRTMREVRRIQRRLRSPQYPGYEPTSQPSLATVKPKPASKLKSRIYQRTHTKQAYDNPNIQPYGQYNSPVGPQPKPKVKRAPSSKQGSKKTEIAKVTFKVK